MQPVRSIFIVLFILLMLLTTGYAGDLNTDLINATKKGDTKAVKSYLSKGADVNAKDAFGQSALSFAAKYGNMEIAKALIANGADVNAKDLMGGGLALNLAASGGYLNIVEALLSAGAKIDEKGQSGMTALAYNVCIPVQLRIRHCTFDRLGS